MLLAVLQATPPHCQSLPAVHYQCHLPCITPQRPSLHWPPLSATSTTSTILNLAMLPSHCHNFRIQDKADPASTNTLQNPD